MFMNITFFDVTSSIKINVKRNPNVLRTFSKVQYYGTRLLMDYVNCDFAFCWKRITVSAKKQPKKKQNETKRILY